MFSAAVIICASVYVGIIMGTMLITAPRHIAIIIMSTTGI